MKTLLFDKPVNLNLLSEELFERFPEWKRPHPVKEGVLITDVSISQGEIFFPEETNEEDVLEVIEAHDKTKESKNQKIKKDKEKHKKNALKKLKDLGLTDEEIEAIVCP